MSLHIRDAFVDGARVSIHIRDGAIAALVEEGGNGTPRAAADPPAESSADPPARVIDAAGLYAFPGLRNGHTHAAMTLFRGWGDDLPLMEWLRTRIWPAEALLTEDDVYHGTRLACLEMIRSGTIYFHDMYWHRAGVVRAVQEMGVRAHSGAVFIDLGDPDMTRRQRADVDRLIEERDAHGDRVRLALAPHAIYTVSNTDLEWLGELARRHDLLLNIHLSETRQEVDDCLAAHGVRPARLLERLGLIGPRLLAAHGVYLDPDEIELLAAGGATVAHNPTANLKLATGGIFDFGRARAAGLRVVLGTDGPASNNNLDMIEEMKTAALVQKHHAADATSLPAAEALALATTSAADVFGPGSGRIAPGEPADLILVDFSHPSTQPVHDPVSTLVYAANGRAVHTTICAGRVLMHAGTVEVCDERDVIAGAARAARALVERA